MLGSYGFDSPRLCKTSNKTRGFHTKFARTHSAGERRAIFVPPPPPEAGCTRNGRGRRSDRIVRANVRYWHKADIATGSTDVRFWGVVLRMSVPDPKRHQWSVLL